MCESGEERTSLPVMRTLSILTAGDDDDEEDEAAMVHRHRHRHRSVHAGPHKHNGVLAWLCSWCVPESVCERERVRERYPALHTHHCPPAPAPLAKMAAMLVRRMVRSLAGTRPALAPEVRVPTPPAMHRRMSMYACVCVSVRTRTHGP
jgi:hypothetical protein